jgi:hypothetical protein
LGNTALVLHGVLPPGVLPYLLYRHLGHVMPMSSFGHATHTKERHASSSRQELSVRE